jgi:hypothetical protein
VQAEGWQYHLDDDVLPYCFVHTSLTDFVDSRSLVTADLATNTQMWKVETGNGQITLGAGNGDVVTAGTGCSVVVDLGAGNSAGTFSMDVASSFNTGSFQLYVMGTDAPWWNDVSRSDALGGLAASDAGFVAANNVRKITSSTGLSYRYWTILAYHTTSGTFGADVWFKITGFRLFGSIGYQSSGTSILKADTVVKNVLGRTAFLTDTSAVSTGTFVIPESSSAESHTPREILSGINAYENYDMRVLVGRKLAFRPRASTAIYEIGNWTGTDFQDASANSGDEIYNRVIVEGTGPDGASLSIQRNAGQAVAQSKFVTTTSPSNPNPSFDANTTGWSVVATAGASGTNTRDTTVFDSAPASNRLDFSIPARGHRTSLPFPRHSLAPSQRQDVHAARDAARCLWYQQGRF